MRRVHGNRVHDNRIHCIRFIIQPQTPRRPRLRIARQVVRARTCRSTCAQPARPRGRMRSMGAQIPPGQFARNAADSWQSGSWESDSLHRVHCSAEDTAPPATAHCSPSGSSKDMPVTLRATGAAARPHTKHGRASSARSVCAKCGGFMAIGFMTIRFMASGSLFSRRHRATRDCALRAKWFEQGHAGQLAHNRRGRAAAYEARAREFRPVSLREMRRIHCNRVHGIRFIIQPKTPRRARLRFGRPVVRASNSRSTCARPARPRGCRCRRVRSPPRPRFSAAQAARKR